MNPRTSKKEQIRQLIISAASVYSRELAGKSFLYVFGEEFFELLFKTDRFRHLTGVDSNLSANRFYREAEGSHLTTRQFFFSQSHTYRNAKKKLSCLARLPELTTKDVIVVKDMTTVTLVYHLGLTNLEFTLGLTENIDSAGNLIDDRLLPRTLRVDDDAIDISADGEIVDFVFSKESGQEHYTTMTFSDPQKKLPESIRGLIDPSLYPNQEDDHD